MISKLEEIKTLQQKLYSKKKEYEKYLKSQIEDLQEKTIEKLSQKYKDESYVIKEICDCYNPRIMFRYVKNTVFDKNDKPSIFGHMYYISQESGNKLIDGNFKIDSLFEEKDEFYPDCEIAIIYIDALKKVLNDK